MTRKMPPIDEQITVLMAGVDYGDALLRTQMERELRTLLEQDRPNIFSQAVANIEPNKAITIDITYFHTLAYLDGAFEFVFPMVVGPRYNPSSSTDGVGAVARGIPGASGQYGASIRISSPASRTARAA